MTAEFRTESFDNNRAADQRLNFDAWDRQASPVMQSINSRSSWSTADSTLVAQGVLPPSMELLQSFHSAEVVQDKTKIALNADLEAGLNAVIPQYLIPVAEQIWKQTEHPLAGIEKKLMDETTASNPRAWEQAISSFPQLKDVPANLMKAYVRNELAFYDRNDLGDDYLAAQGVSLDLPGRRGEDATLGMSQISPAGVRKFEHKYPQLKEFLAQKGYAGHEEKALLDPECVPMIVAAKTASLIDDMKKHHVPITQESLAYAYNPDVYSYSNGHGGRDHKALSGAYVHSSHAVHWDQHKDLYANQPGIVSASDHVKNVTHQLDLIEQGQ
jgi:hypothetical protein